MKVDQAWIEKPVFIVSIGKTGTTLLVAMLDGHQELVVIPEETDFFDASFTPLKVLLKNPLRSKRSKIKIALDLITEQTHLRLLNGAQREHTPGNDNLDYSSFNYNSFKEKVQEYLIKNNLSIKSAINAVPFAYQAVTAHAASPKCWIEKTPYHIINVETKIPTLSNLYPNAKFIHLYREPRDNYWAYKKKTPEKWNPNKFVYDLKRSVEISKKYAANKNHYILRYEDLVMNAQEKIEELCAFMEISFKDSLYTPTKNGIDWKGNSMHDQTFSGISTKSIGKHKDCPNPEHLEYLLSLLKEECAFLGYTTSDRAPSSSEIATFEKYASERKSSDARNFTKYYLKKIQETTLH